MLTLLLLKYGIFAFTFMFLGAFAENRRRHRHDKNKEDARLAAEKQTRYALLQSSTAGELLEVLATRNNDKEMVD